MRGTRSCCVADGRARAGGRRRGSVLLAPGAHDRPVVFPGWTLPGVLTAGAAQTIVKTQRVLPGERIVFAGSGPLALAFPAQLHHYGAHVVAGARGGAGARARATCCGSPRAARGNVDAAARRGRATAPQLLRAPHAAALPPDRRARRGRRAGGGGRARRRRRRLARRPRQRGARRGRHALRRLRVLPLGRAAAPRRLRASPTTRTSAARSSSSTSGCARRSPGISAAGDGTGVEGSYVAVDEGRLAALGAALDLGALARGRRRARGADPRARLAAQAGVPRARCAAAPRSAPASTSWPTPDTVVCRCEEVTRRRARRARSTRPRTSTSSRASRAPAWASARARNCQRQIAALIAAPARPRARRRAARDAAPAGAAGADRRDRRRDARGRGLLRRRVTAALAPRPTSCAARRCPPRRTSLIVGGGLAGAALAYYLACEGVEVVAASSAAS